MIGAATYTATGLPPAGEEWRLPDAGLQRREMKDCSQPPRLELTTNETKTEPSSTDVATHTEHKTSVQNARRPQID